MKRSLLILYTGDDWTKRQPSEGTYSTVYRIWHTVCQQRGIELHRASLRWFDGRRFTKHWRLSSGGAWDKVTHPLLPDVVYDLTRSYDRATGALLPLVHTQRLAISRVTEIVNRPAFADLVDNKANMAVIFHGYMPRTTLRLPGDVVRNPRRRFVVLKGLEGSGGEQVTITKRPLLHVTHPAVEQEFVAATVGGVLRDVRIAFTGERVQYAYYRIARRGTLYTNVHFGARM
ncbi:MAG: hypothetical protein U0514_03695, partial [Candidatus Andersenbacteria bacterium]